MVIGDLLLMLGGLFVALSIRHGHISDIDYYTTHLIPFLILFVSWAFFVQMYGLYDLGRIRDLPTMIRMWFGASTANILWGVAFFYFFYPYSFVGMTPKTNLFLAWAIAHPAILVWRRLLLRGLETRLFTRRVVILGEEGHVREISDQLRKYPQLGYEPVAYGSPGMEMIVADEKWMESNWDKAGTIMSWAGEQRIQVMGLEGFYESLLGKAAPELVASTGWLLGAVYARHGGWYLRVKRWFDWVAAALILLVSSPVTLLAAALIRWFDGSPVFFGQKRVGRMGQEFILWKFRTMKMGADKMGPFAETKVRDEQVTRLGKFLRRYRIDEFPQLWNVMKGEMSLVGPRPEWSAEVDVIEKAIPHYGIRHLVRPGVTGWAQLNFRATNSVGDSLEKFRYDLYYIKHMSLDLDLTILIRTAVRLLTRDSSVPGARFRELKMVGTSSTMATALGSLGRRKR